MQRVEITVGLLSIMASIVITALIGLSEEARMATTSRGFETRSVERGAEMFETFCASCHGLNAAGGICPPLDASSGLHGGDIGDGVAHRLEELGWNPEDAYGYVYATIEGGRTLSTRPELYAGNRDDQNPNVMAMPPWGQDYDGPLRPDQIADLTNYVVAFRDALPDADAEGAYEEACEMVGSTVCEDASE